MRRLLKRTFESVVGSSAAIRTHVEADSVTAKRWRRGWGSGAGYSIRYDEWRELWRVTHEEAEGRAGGQRAVLLTDPRTSRDS
jgi:hypothetical protein